jgi:hypothetical protein
LLSSSRKKGGKKAECFVQTGGIMNIEKKRSETANEGSVQVAFLNFGLAGEVELSGEMNSGCAM